MIERDKNLLTELSKLGGVTKPLEPLKESTEKTLEVYSNRYNDALRKGEEYRKTETKKFGGNPLPGEAGSEKYFHRISS